MKKALFIVTISFLVSCSTYNVPNTNSEIDTAYLKIEKATTVLIDSVVLRRGIELSRGSYIDIRKYKVFRDNNKIKKIEREEIGNASTIINNKTTIYFKNNIPFYIIESRKGTIRLYLLDGTEREEPDIFEERIYIYDWEKNLTSRPESMKLCKVCYEELIEKAKLKTQH